MIAPGEAQEGRIHVRVNTPGEFEERFEFLIQTNDKLVGESFDLVGKAK